MLEWIDALNRTLREVEAHLEDETDAGELARMPGYSPFYLQRIFSMLTETTLGEYLRERRLSEAGVRLKQGDSVLETSLRYGWDSPESFSRAFRKFHGVAPSAARSGQTPLKYVTPLHLTIQLTGGNFMKYTIEEKGELTVVGMERRFGYEDNFTAVPAFWDECQATGLDKIIGSALGICFDGEGDENSFAYMIGSIWNADAPVPEGLTKRTIPAMTWANFECTGPIPGSIQTLNRRIFTEWLPSNGQYEMAAPINIEWYGEGDMSDENYKCGILIPVKPV